MSNLFTFNPFSGIAAGIRLVVNGVNPRNQRSVPPHIACGPTFVAVDHGWKHLSLNRTGRLMAASLRYIEPLSGAKPFETLVPRHEQEKNLYCLIDSSTPRGVKLKVSPEVVRARTAVELSEETRLVIWDNSMIT
jgi:hypothetical protein